MGGRRERDRGHDGRSPGITGTAGAGGHGARRRRGSAARRDGDGGRRRTRRGRRRPLEDCATLKVEYTNALKGERGHATTRCCRASRSASWRSPTPSPASSCDTHVETTARLDELATKWTKPGLQHRAASVRPFGARRRERAFARPATAAAPEPASTTRRSRRRNRHRPRGRRRRSRLVDPRRHGVGRRLRRRDVEGARSGSRGRRLSGAS